MDEMIPLAAEDPRLAAALRDVHGDPPEHEVDWDRMQGAISAKAELPLARLRAAARARSGDEAAHAPAAAVPVRKIASLRTRWLVPAAAAASIALVAVSGVLKRDTIAGSGGQVATQVREPTVDQMVEASMPDPVGKLISGEAESDALLSAAVGT
jgi:hypothetical protein